MSGNLPRGRDPLGASPTTPPAAAEATSAVAARRAAERPIALRARRIGSLGVRAGTVSLLTLRAIALGAVAIIAARPLMLGRYGRTIAVRAIAEGALAAVATP